MLSVEERRALKALDAELTLRHPELAAALSFGQARRKTSWVAKPRTRRLFAALVMLPTAALVTAIWLWGSRPAAPCLPGQGMTTRAALSAAADLSHPMPDNVGCVMRELNQPG